MVRDLRTCTLAPWTCRASATSGQRLRSISSKSVHGGLNKRRGEVPMLRRLSVFVLEIPPWAFASGPIPAACHVASPGRADVKAGLIARALPASTNGLSRQVERRRIGRFAMAESVPSAKFTPRPVRGTRSMARGLLRIAALWRKLARNLGAGYRPERHYMRGPGPKWHERKSRSPV
jgi:hypothetical protein